MKMGLGFNLSSSDLEGFVVIIVVSCLSFVMSGYDKLFTLTNTRSGVHNM